MAQNAAKIYRILGHPLFIGSLLFLFTIIVTAQCLLLEARPFDPAGIGFTHYNNYLIFKYSFFHLIHNKDLYGVYSAEYWDLYKYSPTFALLMAPFAYLPDSFGLFLWNLLNAFILFFAIRSLPQQTEKSKLFMIGFVMIELITSLQNSQSNGLIAGLIIFAFLFLENKNYALGSLCIVFTVFIKLFGLLALALYLFYPNKFKLGLYTLGWTILFALLPLLVISFSQLNFLYQSWLQMLQNDHSVSLGLSAAAWLNAWFGAVSKNTVLWIGLILFCIPLLRYKLYNDLKFRLFFLSSVLIWIVIFNHKAESPTFIIAVSGVSIWFVSQKRKTENIVLVILVYILTVLSPTDFFPRSLRESYVETYILKSFPCILVWIKITTDLLFFKTEKT